MIGIIKKDEKCIIFISLGDIAEDFFSGQYGFELLNVLIGKGQLTLKIDKNTNQFVEGYYRHVDTIKKQNNAHIDANFFINEENQHVSAVLFTDASTCELYDTGNTFLFLNPYATNKVKVKDFPNLVYWRGNKNMEYIPRYKGKNLWNKIY